MDEEYKTTVCINIELATENLKEADKIMQSMLRSLDIDGLNMVRKATISKTNMIVEASHTMFDDKEEINED